MITSKYKIVAYIIFFLVLLSGLIFATYKILKQSVRSMVIENVNEIAEHDMRNIQSHIESRLDHAENIIGRIKYESPEDINALQNLIHIEAMVNHFSKVYLIDKNGKLYSDNFLIYEKDENYFLPYFSGENGKDFARRFDAKNNYYETKKEYILYGYDFHDEPLNVADVELVGIVLLSDIDDVQEKMRIVGLDGKGVSSVINKDGYYIVNVDRNTGLKRLENFFDTLEDERIEGSLNTLEISEKVREHKENVEFKFTDENGIIKYILIKPIENTNWCFVSTIEVSFFTDKTYIFMYITIGTLIAMMVIILVSGALFYVTNIRLKKVYETSMEGVFNRRFYDDKLKEMHIESFVMFDLDHLKYINDGSGHLAGDLAIASTGSAIRKYVGSFGYVVRYGGDEFAVAFKQKMTEEEFSRIIDNILNEIRGVKLEEYPDIKLTLSIGGYYGDGVTKDLFNRADELLYEAKKTRNRAVTNISESD